MSRRVLEQVFAALESYRDAVGCEPRRILTTPAMRNAMWDECEPRYGDIGGYRGDLTVDGVPVVADVRVPPETLYCDEGRT